MAELKPGDVRTFAENLEELRETLRDTHAVDPGVLLYGVVSFDGFYNVAAATGSVELVTHAIIEGLTEIAPFITPSSLVRVELRHYGFRLGREPRP